MVSGSHMCLGPKQAPEFPPSQTHTHTFSITHTHTQPHSLSCAKGFRKSPYKVRPAGIALFLRKEMILMRRMRWWTQRSRGTTPIIKPSVSSFAQKKRKEQKINTSLSSILLKIQVATDRIYSFFCFSKEKYKFNFLSYRFCFFPCNIVLQKTWARVKLHLPLPLPSQRLWHHRGVTALLPW